MLFRQRALTNLADRLVVEAREGCCGQYRKPCVYHDGYREGVERMLDLVLREGEE